ncbi:MAG: class I SAM-dependent RNA methyltransferase, partial [Lachnospiraceae bacterium]|nr:class I SAM-dependent RNA methyltransferase [Lachnospiraceae bacterium]
MSWTKNQEIELHITDLTSEGAGIGKIDGYPFFVKGAIPGDIIRAGVTKVKKTYGYARLIEVVTPSADRVTPPCPEAHRCGGCQLQHMSYEAQLQFKQKKVCDALTRIGGFEVAG